MADLTTTKISPFLWFNDNAEAAVEFYLSVFPNSKKTDVLPGPYGKPMTIGFELEGLSFTALNGGPHFKFNRAVSFFIRCKDQAEIDYYWEKLLADGGAEVQCGWVDDKFGLAWQVVPANIIELVRPPKAFQAMMQMKKLIIGDLEAAAREG